MRGPDLPEGITRVGDLYDFAIPPLVANGVSLEFVFNQLVQSSDPVVNILLAENTPTTPTFPNAKVVRKWKMVGEKFILAKTRFLKPGRTNEWFEIDETETSLFVRVLSVHAETVTTQTATENIFVFTKKLVVKMLRTPNLVVTFLCNANFVELSLGGEDGVGELSFDTPVFTFAIKEEDEITPFLVKNMANVLRMWLMIGSMSKTGFCKYFLNRGMIERAELVQSNCEWLSRKLVDERVAMDVLREHKLTSVSLTKSSLWTETISISFICDDIYKPMFTSKVKVSEYFGDSLTTSMKKLVEQ